MSRVFANDPGYRGSIPGWVIPKSQKIVLDAALHQHHKVRIKGKVEQSREYSLQHLGIEAIEKSAFGSPSITAAKYLFYLPLQLFEISIFESGLLNWPSTPVASSWLESLVCFSLFLLEGAGFPVVYCLTCSPVTS